MVEIFDKQFHFCSLIQVSYPGIIDLVMLYIKLESAAGLCGISQRRIFFNSNVIIGITQRIEFDVQIGIINGKRIHLHGFIPAFKKFPNRHLQHNFFTGSQCIPFKRSIIDYQQLFNT